MSILGEITVSSEADYETGFLYPIPGSLIPLLYVLSDFICVFFLLPPICAAKFFKGFICTVLSIWSLIAVTCCYIIF